MTNEQAIRQELLKASGNRGEFSKIAKALGVSPSTVTRWIPEGIIPPPMLKLLNLYFFEVMPFDIAQEKLLNSVLDFTEDQYRVICILASRKGITPAVWIADQIRSYLAFNEEAKAETSKIVFERMARNASHLQILPDSKVAEDTPDLPPGKTGPQTTELEEEA